MNTTSKSQQVPSSDSHRSRHRILAVVAAGACAVGVWAVASVIGVKVQSPAFGSSQRPRSLNGAFIFAFAILVSLAAWGLLALLERRTSRAATAWKVAASVVLVLSLSAPFSGNGISLASRVTLLLMHVAVGAVLLAVLPRTVEVSHHIGRPGARSSPAARTHDATAAEFSRQ